MLEGNEIEAKLGDVGTVTVDVSPDLKVRAQVTVEVDLVSELKRLAEKTNTPIDDMAIAWIERVVKAVYGKKPEAA